MLGLALLRFFGNCKMGLPACTTVVDFKDKYDGVENAYRHTKMRGVDLPKYRLSLLLCGVQQVVKC